MDPSSNAGAVDDASRPSIRSVALDGAGGPPKPPRTTGRAALESQLLASLECPVCMEYMAPPIPLCENGHSVCGECAVRVKDCPACRRPMLRTRNLALESLARSLRYPCRHAAAGCTARLDADDVLKHAQLCPHRPLPCALSWGVVGADSEKPSTLSSAGGLPSCLWSGPVAALRAHLVARHPRRFSDFAAADANARAVAWELSQAGCFRVYSHVVFAFGEAFVYWKRFDVQERRLVLAVARVGGGGGGAFRYKFKASRPNGARLSLSAAVHTLDDDVTALECSGAAIAVPFEALVAFGSGATRVVSIRKERPPRDRVAAAPPGEGPADKEAAEGRGDAAGAEEPPALPPRVPTMRISTDASSESSRRTTLQRPKS